MRLANYEVVSYHSILHSKCFSISRKSAPQFLLDVYHRLNEEEDEDDVLMRSKRNIQNDDNFITDLDKQAIDQSDIIMTFLNKSKYLH